MIDMCLTCVISEITYYVKKYCKTKWVLDEEAPRSIEHFYLYSKNVTQKSTQDALLKSVAEPFPANNKRDRYTELKLSLFCDFPTPPPLSRNIAKVEN